MRSFILKGLKELLWFVESTPPWALTSTLSVSISRVGLIKHLDSDASLQRRDGALRLRSLLEVETTTDGE